MKAYQPIHSTRYILSICLLCLSLFGEAQTYIDEDFLDNIDKNARFMIDQPEAEFKTNQTPAKWNSESAVVMGYSRSILFDKKSRGGFLTRKERSLWFVEKDHFKIKVNDNNSVESFSEIYFRYGTTEDGFIARIIKQDGTIVNIDLKNAVGVENTSDVPEYFKSFFDKVANSEYHYYKTPVPSLEPGDILEYVSTTKSKLDVTAAGYIEFSPVYEVCSKGYPIMFNEIDIETDDKSFFKYLSLNGAPKFIKQDAPDAGFFKYVFVDKDRDKEKDVNFVSPLLHYPLVKFQVIYSNNDQAKGALIGQKGELKSQFTREELARKAWEDYQTVGDERMDSYTTVQNFINQLWGELMKLDGKSLNEKQYVDKAYYLLRNKIVFRDNYFSDRIFAYVFGSLLYQRDIKSDLVITIGNNVGKLNEVLFADEIRYAIRVGDKLYFNITDFSNPDDIVENLLDNEAYIIYPPAKKSVDPEIKPLTLPGTTAADNIADVAIKAELSPDMKRLMVIRTSSYKGLQKTHNIANELKLTPYMFDDYRNYGGNAPTDNMKANQIDEYNTSVRSLKDEFKKEKPELVKQNLQSEYQQPVDNVHFEVVTDGRSRTKNTLVVKEGFELSSFVRKAGKKYLINLAGLTGSQLQIKKEERERKIDIDVRYPRTFTWTINFKIPDGYTVQGLSEISHTVDNETGSFSVAAKEENGEVVVNITKLYKQKNIPKEKWNEMLAFIDAAYNSSFKYILLIPKQ
ncbi:MAG: hypothetical protein ACJ75B_20275 [Flavisolibacter sp.]